MDYSSARPKRAAEDYARTHHDHDFGQSDIKKPRFDIRNPSALAPDALEEDATLEADVIGKRGQQVRRQAVNVDGYDSDSENENFDARAATRAKAQEAESKSKDEEESDMFADLEEDFKDGDDSEGDGKRRGGKKKQVEFMDADEIEGQVQNSKSGGHVSADFSMNGKGKSKTDDEHESSSESEVDDETRASLGGMDEELGAGAKKTHAPTLDAFNMRNENEEGRFDDQGNYVRKAVDPDAVHDSWLEGISKKEMRKAREAHERREKERREKDILDDSQSTSDILRKLLPLLDTGETSLEALARLGRSKNKKRKSNNGIHGHVSGHVSGELRDSQKDDAEVQRKVSIEAITEAADLLLSRGQVEIHDTERELLVRQYRRETGEDWVEPDSKSRDNAIEGGEKTWEYRWADARDGGEAHGPFDGLTMKQWHDAGYFGEGVEYHKVDSSEAWNRAVDFL